MCQAEDTDQTQTQTQSAENVSGHSPGQPLSLYEPLSEDRDCTRLLRINTGNDSDPITCSLFEVGFCDKPKFDALSYVWGSGKAEQKITLNGHEFSVRQNLWDALYYLRKHCPNTNYWIHAICINQNDIDERNRQVRIMHHIYFRAQTVVVWLGKVYSKYEKALSSLNRLGHKSTSNEETTPESVQEPNETNNSVRELAVELCNDAYWKRLWIIQEIGLAREIKVCFGNSAVEWNLFTQLLVTNGVGSEGPMKLEKQRQDKYTGSNTLLRLLFSHQEAECQDRKDKVYGLLGLASDARGFVIDYNKSLFEIWTDVMEFMNDDNLFSDEDIVRVGYLVKFLLMGPECDPLQHILRSYEPRNKDDTIITDKNHYKSFELPSAIVGCVIHVGPQPHEIIGKLKVVDNWIQHVQVNYSDNVGNAHRESDELISAILDLDNSSFSRKCFDCRSTIQWDGNEENNIVEAVKGWHGKTRCITQCTVQVSADSPRLFQMSVKSEKSTPWRLGMSSSDIRVGDIVCWLELPRRAVVVRRYGDLHRRKLQVVGTAVITADLKEASLGHSQRQDWQKNRLTLKVYLDTRTIFTLLSD
ncbi:hypothetical protein FPOAC1_011476 [Fusarium poae]|jgi:hypothetical protein|uniref:hypothetical protein n=1 Tax=Fusarium poae TaxID=36050 RepID=UPI001CEBA0ED|nr:hypothetical protein FPOAC1_011476 [Fusarium poae]KAG8666666.1 hypothetical protein FPOAC1_011476 [Fusarium poae]